MLPLESVYSIDVSGRLAFGSCSFRGLLLSIMYNLLCSLARTALAVVAHDQRSELEADRRWIALLAIDEGC